ncbi:MAG: hypothetical protein NWE89_16605 [Candidatus Bathyarchaeota archaeon]|nr:hypothetical protein [Candidatus Bathyarchaeota archaeon]
MSERAASIALIVLLLSVCVHTAYTQTDTVEHEGDLILVGTEIKTITDTVFTVKGSLILDDYASLILVNSKLILAEVPETSQTYELRGHSSLTAINSNITWTERGGIRVKDNATATLTGTYMFTEYQLRNRTYYSHGFGLSENSRLTAEDSTIGYTRLMDTATITVNNSTIGEFATRSMNSSEITDSTILKPTLVYQGTTLQLNQSITGLHEQFKPEHLVKEGETSHSFTLTRTRIMNAPRLELENCQLEAENISLNLVRMMGKSSITLRDSDVDMLYLITESWADINNTRINTITLREGDFNIRLRETEIDLVQSLMTTGLNFKTYDTVIDTLSLEFAYPGSPNNIELTRTRLNNLRLRPGTPPIYQFQDSTIMETITTEATIFEAQTPILTGSLSFDPNCTLVQETKGGITELRRIYKFIVTSRGEPAQNQEYTLTRNETVIREGTTDMNGEEVLTLNYIHLFETIENPQPGGPYLRDQNNLTDTVTLHVGDTETQIGLLTGTPIHVELQSQPPKGGTATQTAGVIAGTAGLIIVYWWRKKR